MILNTEESNPTCFLCASAHESSSCRSLEGEAGWCENNQLRAMDKISGIPVICVEGQTETWALARRISMSKGDCDIHVVRSPATVGGVASLARQMGPAVLLTDDSFLPTLSRAGAVKFVFRGEFRILLVTPVKTTPESTLQYLRRGCCGIIHPDDPPHFCRKAIQRVADGELWLPRKVISGVVRQLIGLHPEPAGNLTRRESEILELVGLGLNNKQIAGQLFISEETVRWHMRSMYGKIGVSDRNGVIRFWHLYHAKDNGKS
jgi:DNA-binding NarL/FixJ family response regulator